MYHVYPALFHRAADGISVEFPDLPGALTCGDTYEEAFRMAQDCLALHLAGLMADGDPIPAPSRFEDVRPAADEVVMLVDARR